MAVSKLPKCGIALGPGVHARAADRFGSSAPQWLVVVAECEQQVNRAIVCQPRTAKQVAAVVAEPTIEVFLPEAS